MTPEAQPIALLSDNYAYLLPTGADHALVVDPSEPQGVREALERAGRSLEGILITHHHHDHIGGIEALVSEHLGPAPLPVVASSHDVARCRVPRATASASDGQRLTLAGQDFEVMLVPGHTQGAVAYLWRQGNALFTGDTLFLGGCGRLIEGEASQLYASLLRLRQLPDDPLICCGHEYTRKNLAFAAHIEPDNEAVRRRIEALGPAGTAVAPTVPARLSTERATNPFLRADDLALARRLGTPPGLATFIELRRLRDAW